MKNLPQATEMWQTPPRCQWSSLKKNKCESEHIIEQLKKKTKIIKISRRGN